MVASATLEVEPMSISIDTNLTKSVKEMTYAKNCHYLRLKDEKGKETKLIEHGVIRYWCVECENLWFQPTNNSVCCPACKGNKISQQWMKPQLSLIPEDESSFEMPPKK